MKRAGLDFLAGGWGALPGVGFSCFDRLATVFPDDAGGSMPAVEFRVGAGHAGLQAGLAIAVFKLVAEDYGGNLGMESTSSSAAVHR